MTLTVEVVLESDGSKFTYSDDPAAPVNHKPGLDAWFIPGSVVFHLGRTRTAALGGADIAHLGAYTATVYRDGVQIAQKRTPNHLWNTLWRIKLTPSQIIRTPQQVFDLKLIQPWGIITAGQTPPGMKWTMPGPMQLGPVTAAMGATGERPDIGRVNEGTGHWLQTGDASDMLAYAEGLLALDIFDMDDLTGRPFDMIANPKISTYPNQLPTDKNDPRYIIPAPASVPGQGHWDMSHHPEQIAAFYATGDILHLLVAQYAAVQNFIWTNFNYGLEQPYSVMTVGQIRGLSHGLRTLIDTYLGTKLYEDTVGPVPAYLHPSSYFKALIENERQFLTKVYMQNPAMAIYRFLGLSTSPAPWQMDHGHNILPLYAVHFPEWRDLCVWLGKNLIDRCSGKTGHPAAYPGPYRMLLGYNFPVDQSLPAKNGVILTSPSEFFTKPDGTADWAKVADFNLQKSITDPSGQFFNLSKAQAEALIADPFNGGNWMQANTYDMYITRNALATMVWADRVLGGLYSQTYPELEATYALQESMAVKLDALPGDQIPARQSALVPVNYSPIPQPPAGDISLSTPGNLTVGQTAHITLSYDDGHGSPSQAPTGVIYAASPAGVVSVTPDATGAVVAAVAPGAFQIDVTADGGLKASITGSVALPLAGALHLAWG